MATRASGTKKKRGLGRGLDALLGPETKLSTESRQHELPIKDVVPNQQQPRRRFDQASLRSLADSILSQGVLQPINVRPLTSGKYEIISGERRFRAARMAGLKQIPAQVLSLSQQHAYAASLVENIQREDLNVVEEARALHRLLHEFGVTHATLAKSLGRARTSITNSLRLLKLSPSVLSRLEAGELEMGQGRALLAVPAHLQASLVERIIAEGLSVRQTEQLVARRQEGRKSRRPEKPRDQDPDTIRLAGLLSDQLGATVSLQPGVKKDSGRLVIQYGSNEQLQEILTRLKSK